MLNYIQRDESPIEKSILKKMHEDITNKQKKKTIMSCARDKKS